MKKLILKYSILMLTLLFLSTSINLAASTAGTTASALANTFRGPQSATEVEKFLDDYFSQDPIKKKINALTVAVVQNSQVLARKGYGVTDRSTNTPVQTDQTVFRVASVSKVFTALAIMQLVDQGKIGLQDNIENYLDGYKVNNPFATPVTVEMLLTHSTGFEVRDPSSNSFMIDASLTPISLKDEVFKQFPPVKRKPGSSYMYDNFAYALLGYIVQQVSGEAFDAYMEKHVFQPLGMTSSSFRLPTDLAKRLATVYDASGKPRPVYRLSPEIIPQGSMVTTSDDIVRFMQAFLNDGKLPNGTSIVSPASIKAMETYQVAIHPQVADVSYGFEAPFMLKDTNGQHVIAKGGDIPGFSSYLWMLPDSQTGVFISYTATGGLRDDFFTAFMDHYYPSQKTQFGKADFMLQSASELHKFAGLYTDLRTDSDIIKVSVVGDGRLDVYTPWVDHEQVTQVDDKLFVDVKGRPLAFQTDSQDNITYMKYNNPLSYSAKVPEALGYPDITNDHPYAAYIQGLQSLSLLSDVASQPFQPLKTVTRGQFIHDIVQQFHFRHSSQKASFTDISASVYQDDILSAANLGLVVGVSTDLFEPNRPILRQEAAVILSRIIHHLSDIKVPTAALQLTSGTDDWALADIQTVLALKLYGPEVTTIDGTIDFGSKRALTKQEESAMLYNMLVPNV
ncbi:hypothetical protein GCM10008018_31300 [Paenibacillus marchantiophytorum]|uniref:SLH domain-containing protein n=1 Tax=Paenibacillus marchantiophytorum TaxID=1619310 RepID=A0ABQ1EQW7_9BACL|nr:serine hydrolase [Paenibacillus marchantiophytorum]GFZ83094.1 hypothetical protein GCM10008018_31300 [Paenibacillus marchantiophytorum]